MSEIEVHPLGGHIGAEIRGVDLASPSDAEIAKLRAAVLEYEVVFFRETGIDDAAHLALAGRFGAPSIFPLLKVMGATEPSFQVIADGPDSPPTTDYWHTDVTWTSEPPDMAFLRATRVPPRGGDTMWGSMTAAYEALSAPMRQFFDVLEILHGNESFIEGTIEKLGRERVEELDLATKLRADYPPVVHPLVRVHPETGRKAIFFGGHFMQCVQGLARSESDAVLDFVRRHIDQPRFHCRWRWQVGDLAIWDERATVHRGVADHFPERREVRRCVIDGERPVGPGARA